MAINKGNQVMKGARGMFAGQVIFKERLGTEYVAGPPVVNENRKAGEAETKNRYDFGKAVRYGKEAVKDDKLKAEYEALRKTNQTAYNVAVSDARIPPKINSLLAHGYNGKAGSSILVNATDNVKVKRVHVTIHDRNKTLIEEGQAADNGDHTNWIYTATVTIENAAGCTIEARAYDIAENVAIRTAVV